MQKAKVIRNKKDIGFLSKEDNGNYMFTYFTNYIEDVKAYPISVNFPKQKESFVSKHLFSFFSAMLSEGGMKEMQCRTLQIDENDDFTRLLKTATKDTIGSIIIEEIV
jgi:serine/threonine-protein kinase HipA